MFRRSVLALLVSGFLSGCVDSVLDSRAEEVGRRAEDYRALEIAAVYPDEVERRSIDYECVQIENTGDVAVDLTGIEVRYGGGNVHRFDGPRFESGAIVLLVSRTMEESTYLMSPPAYLRSAGFGEDPSTSVLDGSGTVRLVSPDGTTIDERDYSTNS